MSRLDRNTLQTLGFALVILGIILILVGLFSTQMYNCPARGCPPGTGYSGVPSASFFSGVTLVVIGIVLIIVARNMKPK